MRLTVLFNEDNACDYHRLIMAISYLPIEQTDSIRLVNHKDCLKDTSIYQCDILMFSRTFHHEVGLLKSLKDKFGFKLVIDYDDNHQLHYSHPLHKMWIKTDIGGQMQRCAKLADYLIVTNDELYKVYSKLNPKIEIIPNGIAYDREPFVANRVESDRVRFIYAGGSSHLPDLRKIQNLFLKLKSDNGFKEKASFILAGYNNNAIARNVWDHMESIVKPCGSYERRNSLPLSEYITHYNYADIATAPIEDNEFNRGKSNLKFLEASAMKMPFICSNLLPYTIDISQKDKGIKFCQNTAEWFSAIKFFIKNKSAIYDYGQANYEYGKQNYNLENFNIHRLGLLKSLL